MEGRCLYYYVYWFVGLFYFFPIISCASYVIPEATSPVVNTESVSPLPSYSSEADSSAPESPVSANSSAVDAPSSLADRPVNRHITVIAKQSWMNPQLRIDRNRLLPHSATIQRITIHHTATALNKNARFSLRGIQRYHIIEKGWADIAYHYLIAPDGKIYAGRAAVYMGSSSTDYKLDRNLMVALIGNFEKYSPSPAALLSLKNLVVNKLVKYNLKPEAVYTHGEQADTLCPGRYLKSWYEKQGKGAISQQFYTSLAVF